MEIYYPYQIGAHGTTAGTSLSIHLRDLLEQVLFTDPGERVNRPTFGGGVRQLVFAPAGDEVATTAEFLIQSSLMQFLGDVIHAENVSVTIDDATLQINITYVDLITGRREEAAFTRTLTMV
jgi:phage baseplate assembly protein W